MTTHSTHQQFHTKEVDQSKHDEIKLFAEISPQQGAHHSYTDAFEGDIRQSLPSDLLWTHNKVLQV